MDEAYPVLTNMHCARLYLLFKRDMSSYGLTLQFYFLNRTAVIHSYVCCDQIAMGMYWQYGGSTAEEQCQGLAAFSSVG